MGTGRPESTRGCPQSPLLPSDPKPSGEPEARREQRRAVGAVTKPLSPGEEGPAAVGGLQLVHSSAGSHLNTPFRWTYYFKKIFLQLKYLFPAEHNNQCGHLCMDRCRGTKRDQCHHREPLGHLTGSDPADPTMQPPQHGSFWGLRPHWTPAPLPLGRVLLEGNRVGFGGPSVFWVWLLEWHPGGSATHCL